MPRIPDFIMNSIVYLYQDATSAETGVDQGGSGFLLSMRSDLVQTASHYYAVTNAHVIRDGFTVVRINRLNPTASGRLVEWFEFSKTTDWIEHSVHDLAVCAMPPDLDPWTYRLSVMKTDLMVTQHECVTKNIGPGDDLVYIGRFMGHAGKYENLPSVRFGNLSSMPNEREPVEYEVDGQRRRQVGFLVEARSRSGYSGSPVFFLHRHAINDSRTVLPDLDLRLLGVDWGHIPERVQLLDPGGYLHGSHWFVEVHAGIMGVVPAWYLDEFIRNDPRLSEQRRRDDEWYLVNPPTGYPLDSADPNL